MSLYNAEFIGVAQNSSSSFRISRRLWLTVMREEVSKKLEGNKQKPE